MSISDTQPEDLGSKPISEEEAPKSRRALSRLTRELSDDDLKSPGVQKLLLESLAEAEEEIVALKAFREKFHEADKRNAVLEEKRKTDGKGEFLSTGTIAIGAAALVYGPSEWGHQPTGIIALAFGVALTLVGIFAKVRR